MTHTISKRDQGGGQGAEGEVADEVQRHVDQCERHCGERGRDDADRACAAVGSGRVRPNRSPR